MIRDPRLYTSAQREPLLLSRIRQCCEIKWETPKQVVMICPKCQGCATYHLPSEQNGSMGVYVCSGPGNCSIQDILTLFELSDRAAVMRPMITLRSGSLEIIYQILLEDLRDSGMFFHYGDHLVKIICSENGQISLDDMDESSLFIELQKTYSFWSDKNKQVDLKQPFLTRLLSLSRKYLEEICAISYQPTIGFKGEIVSDVGFNKTTKIYAAFNKSNFQDLGSSKSRLDAKKAYASLCQLISEVPFAEDVDQVATISSFLTAVLRPNFLAAPLIVVDASHYGSGKSTLCEGLIGLSTIAPIQRVTFHQDDDELKRILFAALRENPGALFFDNVKEEIRSVDTLCSLLTQGVFSDRLIRTSQMQTVQCRALILANGNNLRVCDDMVRRTLRIRLNIQDVSSPRNYTQPSLKDYLITHRDEVINNVLVIVKAWQDDGCCRSKTAFSSFETWDFYCRQPLLWLTSVDPLQRTLEAIDRQFSEIHQTNHPIEYQIFDSLYQIFHSSAFSVSDISRHITEELLNRLIKNSLATKEGEVNTRKLGHWLRHNSGKQIQGLKLGAIDSYKKVKKYTIEKVIYESNH